MRKALIFMSRPCFVQSLTLWRLKISFLFFFSLREECLDNVMYRWAWTTTRVVACWVKDSFKEATWPWLLHLELGQRGFAHCSDYSSSGMTWDWAALVWNLLTSDGLIQVRTGWFRFEQVRSATGQIEDGFWLFQVENFSRACGKLKSQKSFLHRQRSQHLLHHTMWYCLGGFMLLVCVRYHQEGFLSIKIAPNGCTFSK